MGRRKKRHVKWETIRTEDELRAEAAAIEAQTQARSDEAIEQVIAATHTVVVQNPFDYVNRLSQPVFLCLVSLYGLNYAGWSPASVVVCFWFEKLARIALVAARIYIHQVATHKRGHFRAPIEFVAKRSHSHRLKLEGTRAPQAGRLHVHGDDSAREKKATGQPVKGTLFKNFVGLCAISEVIGLIVMLFALNSMDEWTNSTSVWGFIKQEWLSKSWIIVLPLVIQFVLDTIFRLRNMSFAAVKTMAITTHSSTSLFLPVFWAALLIAHYSELSILEPLVYVLIVSKTLYEISLVVFGRQWESSADARLMNKLWGREPNFASYAKREAKLRIQDEEVRS